MKIMNNKSVMKFNTSKKSFSEQQISEIVHNEDIRLIQLQFVDIHGSPKQMTVHASILDRVLNNEIMLDGSSIAGFRSIETSDMYFYPDLATFQVLPWLSGGVKTVRFMCDIYNADGTPFEGCPRNNLKRVLKKAENLGYTYNVGPELEFFLFKKHPDGSPSLETQDKAGYYELSPDDLGEDVRIRIVETLESLGYSLEASHHEVAYGQHEIDFEYSDALDCADKVINFKAVVRKIASEHGFHATFMPKPIAGINGSGMHCNQSLSDLDGKNVFVDDNGKYQLSTECHQYIAGLLHHMPALSILTNPTVNSYKRLVPGYEAPVYIAWSPSNRSALIRIPAKRGNATRVELRCPDPSANPYLAFAGMLTAGIDGIEKKMTPPEPVQTNIYDMSSKELKEQDILSLPSDMKEAVLELQKSDIIKEALGEHIYDELIKAKNQEWKEYSLVVSPWELNKYLAKI